MNVPLGKGDSGRGRRPTAHQLQMARIRARTTGESVAHVLSVFMGVGRYGAEADAETTGPEAPLTGDASGPHDLSGCDTEGPGQLAPVIPLSRAQGKDASQDAAEEATEDAHHPSGGRPREGD